jgi:hypothetical protein
MRPRDQRALVDRMDDAAAPEKRLQIDEADRGGIAPVMQRRVGRARRDAATS